MKVISLAKNAGQHNAVMAGLNYASGDLLIAMDDDMQTHPSQLKYLLAEIEKAVGAFFAQKQQQTARRVSFDLSKLQSIRADAEATREQLLTEVDEEALRGIETPAGEAEPAAAPAMITEPPPAAPDTPPDEELPLDENETALLRILLYGGDLQALLRERGLLLSMVADSINEKLFDRFSDTVLLFDGETPEPVEDYLEQLKGWIQP